VCASNNEIKRKKKNLSDGNEEKSEENCFENTSKLLLFRFYNNVRAVLKSGLTGP